MDPAVRAAHQNATNALKQARKLGGPKTPEGKTRSAMNALRHGLSASHLLLPGEAPSAYEAFMDGYFASLAPTSMPEAVIVAQIGDLSWKLERLTKLENNRLLARLEEELEKTDAFLLVTRTLQAQEAVSRFIAIVDTRRTSPKEPELTEALLKGLESTLVVLRKVPGLPEAVIQPLSLAVEEARDTCQEGRLKQTAYESLGDMAKLTRGALAAKLAQDEAGLGPVRERLAAEVLLLEDADLKKLEKYRRTLEASLLRQVELLGKMRSQVAVVEHEALTEAKELRVKLRLVQ